MGMGTGSTVKTGTKTGKDDIIYDFWWANFSRNYGAPLFRIALEAGGAKRLFEMDRKALTGIRGITEGYADEIVKYRSLSDPFEEYERCKNLGIRFLPYYCREYPERLRKVPCPPFGVFVKGRVPDDDKKSVALIGARNCTEYGKRVAGLFGRRLGESGIQVISGMACGIDGIAQSACIEGGGESFGVLGCGVNICYPAANEKLYLKLEKTGGLISEYGIDTPPKRNLFPPRNRIISALSDLVVVIEARERSGTGITVDMALEQGKDVAVVPGRITDPLSAGCLSLLRQGAFPVTSAEDILELLRVDEKEEGSRERKKERAGEKEEPRVKRGSKEEKESGTDSGKELSGPERKVWENLDVYAKGINRLCDETGLSLLECMSAVMKLQMKKKVREMGKDSYVRVL